MCYVEAVSVGQQLGWGKFDAEIARRRLPGTLPLLAANGALRTDCGGPMMAQVSADSSGMAVADSDVVAGGAEFGAAGMRSVKAVPLPGALSTRMRP